MLRNPQTSPPSSRPRPDTFSMENYITKPDESDWASPTEEEQRLRPAPPKTQKEDGTTRNGTMLADSSRGLGWGFKRRSPDSDAANEPETTDHPGTTDAPETAWSGFDGATEAADGTEASSNGATRSSGFTPPVSQNSAPPSGSEGSAPAPSSARQPTSRSGQTGASPSSTGQPSSSTRPAASTTQPSTLQTDTAPASSPPSRQRRETSSSDPNDSSIEASGGSTTAPTPSRRRRPRFGETGVSSSGPNTKGSSAQQEPLKSAMKKPYRPTVADASDESSDE